MSANQTTGNRLNYNPANNLSKKGMPALLGTLTFIILASLFGQLAWQRYLIKEKAIQQETLWYVTATKEKLQEALSHGISAAKILSLFIQKDGSVKNFDSLAAQILLANSNIGALQLLPGGVLSQVYPLVGNEKVIGHNIVKDRLRNKEAQKAIDQKELFFAGPFTLKQGGIGIAGRLPIYRDNRFWGFTAVIIKLSTLLKMAGIDSLGSGGYYFQLSKINPDTKQEEFFISHPPGIKLDNPVSAYLPDGAWKLSASPLSSSNKNFDIVLLSLMGFLLSGLAGAFVFTVAKRPVKLEILVKKRTMALAESEEKYRSLIEQASDGIIVYSFDGTIQQFNKTAFVETGYTREEFALLNLKDLLAERNMTIGQAKADALQAGKTAILQRQLIRKDGTLMDIEINVSMLSDTSLLAFVRNSTDRKKAERALMESEEKFSRVFQSDLVGLVICDDNYRLIDVNECFAKMEVTNHEALISKGSAEAAGLLTSESMKKSGQILEVVFSKIKAVGPLKNLEIEIKKNDGNLICLLVSAEPLELVNGRNWLVSAIDITDKKHAELLMVQNEMKYRSLIEQASDGIIISGFDGVITEVNKSICLMGGYQAEEMVGSHITKFMPGQDIDEQPLRIEELLQGRGLLYERRMLKKDGSITDVEINSKMTIGNTLIGFVRDITERKKAGHDLKLSNERFELIAKATNDAIWDHDFIKNETVGNQNLYNLYGFTAGKNKIDFEMFYANVHPDEQEQIERNLQKAFSEKAAFISEEFRFKTASGSFKHFYDRAYVKYNDKGVPVRMLGVMQDVTGRIEDKQRIIKEKELADTIINSLPAVFYLFNEAGQFLKWNKNFETVTGYNGHEVANLHPLDLFDAEEKILLAEKIRNVFLSGQDNVTASFVLKNKQKIPYYFSGMTINYEGEKCLMGFGLDFSDKVKADSAIKESEQKFRSLVEQASDAVAVLTPQGSPLYISPSVERVLGYTEMEAMQLNAFALTHPEDLPGVQKVFAYVLQYPGRPVKGPTARMLHKDGTWHWFESTVTNMLHVPSINGVLENFRDVTEKREIEKRIITEKELSDTIINSLPGIFYLYDQTGKFIRWNKNFEKVTGYRAEEIINMHPGDFYDPGQQPNVEQNIQDILQEKILITEFYLVSKEKKRIPFYYNSLAIEYEGLTCIMAMGFDVTDRKKIEQELLVSNELLEQKAIELTSSYNELERFAYIVSHDLQEPLRMVSSFLKLLDQKYKPKLDETARKYIHFAVDGAGRMKHLITDLLEYSRTGTNKDIAADTDMNMVMADVLAVMKNSIEEQQATIEVAPLPTLPGTSKLQMFQIMQNLVSNSLKYHNEKAPAIRISATEETDNWVFSIQDNGIGIDPKFYEKIFIIFQRLHNKQEFTGSGIGLSICKKIVEKNGGKIWVHSAPGNGSTFYFTIPKTRQQ